MKNSRYSQKHIEIVLSNINHYTEHKAIAYYTQGCGTTLSVDGVIYNHLRKDGSTEGLSPKKCIEILRQYSDEIKIK